MFRICYFKNAFDGESKLQILNGNYRIPESPKYSVFVTDLIKDMLQASPDERPDITQVKNHFLLVACSQLIKLTMSLTICPFTDLVSCQRAASC